MRVAFLLLLALLGAAVRGAQANRRYNYTVTVGPWAPFPLDPNDSNPYFSFGSAVYLTPDGKRVFVSAPVGSGAPDTDVINNYKQGYISILSYNAKTKALAETQRLLAPPGFMNYTWFGYDMVLDPTFKVMTAGDLVNVHIYTEDKATGKWTLRQTLQDTEWALNGQLALSKGGKILVAQTTRVVDPINYVYDNYLVIYRLDPKTNQYARLQLLKIDAGGYQAASITPDSKWIALGDTNRDTVNLFKRQSNGQYAPAGHLRHVQGSSFGSFVAFSPDSKQLAICAVVSSIYGSSGSLAIATRGGKGFRITQAGLSSPTGPGSEFCDGVTWSPEGKYLAVADTEGFNGPFDSKVWLFGKSNGGWRAVAGPIRALPGGPSGFGGAYYSGSAIGLSRDAKIMAAGDAQFTGYNFWMLERTVIGKP